MTYKEAKRITVGSRYVTKHGDTFTIKEKREEGKDFYFKNEDGEWIHHREIAYKEPVIIESFDFKGYLENLKKQGCSICAITLSSNE